MYKLKTFALALALSIVAPVWTQAQEPAADADMSRTAVSDDRGDNDGWGWLGLLGLAGLLGLKRRSRDDVVRTARG